MRTKTFDADRLDTQWSGGNEQRVRTLARVDSLDRRATRGRKTPLASVILVALAVMFSADSNAQAKPASAAPTEDDAQVDAKDLAEVEVHGSFIERGTKSAMKVAVDVMDTPYSVSSYSSSFMNAIEAVNVGDLFKYMTGIQKAGSSAQDITIRGFKTGGNDRNAMMVDGLPGLTGRFASPPTIGVEHIDVVRGPASVLYGQAQPGGFVNLVTKKPKDVASTEIQLKGTSYAGDKLNLGDANGHELGIDTTGPLDARKRFLYRFIAQYNDTDTFRDFTYNRGTYVAPSVRWQMSEATSATLSFEYRKYKNAYDKYLTAPGKDIRRIAPITTHYQQPGDFQEEVGKSSTLSAEHLFGNGTVWNFSARMAETDDKAKAFDAVSVRPGGKTIARRAVRNANSRTSAFFDTNLELFSQTGSIGHQMIVGINGGRDTTNLKRIQFFNGPATGPQSLDIDIYHPVYDNMPTHDMLPLVNPATPNNLTNRFTRSRAMGAYAADLMTLSDRWKLNLGLRYTYDSQHIEERRIANVPSTDKSANKLLPQAGLLYQPSDRVTLYSSYSTSYVPAAPNVQDANGRNPFDPESSKQLELGSKVDALDGRLRATLALFSIEKKNLLTSYTCPIGTCSEQIGAEQSKGVEFELDTRPAESWQVLFGLAHTKAEISRSKDPAQVGAKLANTAENAAHIWSRYDVTHGAMKGFGFGVGVSYTGTRAGNLPSSQDKRIIRLPGYMLSDLALYYSVRHARLTLKVGNLFDKVYYESTGLLAETQVQPGVPRNVSLSVRIPL